MDRDQIAKRLAQIASLRKAAQEAVETVLQASFGEARAQTEEEQAKVAEARATVEALDTEKRDLEKTDNELRLAEESETGTSITDPGGGEQHTEERSAEAGKARKRAGAVVTREPRTYERHDIRSSYLRDLAATRYPLGNIDPDEAQARLSRHANEVRVDLPQIERRLAAQKGGYAQEIREEGDDRSYEIRYEQEKRDLDRTDGSGGELVPPLWMVEDWISVARASRVVADQCNMMPLPAGTDSINVPRVATGTTTAIQTADNAAISDTDATTDSVQANVKTIAGQQDISLQAVEQSPIAFDQIIFSDLGEDHAVKTDVQVIDGSNAGNQVRGILAIPSIDTTAYTDASPTVAELYPKLADSANQVASTRFRPVTHIFMHPRRWYWLLAAVDSSNRPLVAMNAQGPQNALIQALDGNPFAEGGIVGMTPFGPIWIDPNIPTAEGGGTEDVIIETRAQELYLWEGPVRTRVLESPGSDTLTLRFQLYNYLAFMPHRRAASTSIISGTGLVPPTF